MAGSWGDDGSRPDLWASLHTVMNAQFEELDPHLERFDLDDLVRFRRNLQQSIELQFERQFAEQEAREAAATSTPASSEPAAVASSSGSQDVPARAPDQQTQQVAAETTQDAAAKPAGTGPPPTMGKPKNMSQQAKGVRQGRPATVRSGPQQERQGQRERWWLAGRTAKGYNCSGNKPAGASTTCRSVGHTRPGSRPLCWRAAAADGGGCQRSEAGHRR